MFITRVKYSDTNPHTTPRKMTSGILAAKKGSLCVKKN